MEILITVTAQGQVNVKGPIENKVMAYGLLEVAKEAIAAFHANKANGSIVPATPLDGLKLARN